MSATTSDLFQTERGAVKVKYKIYMELFNTVNFS